MSTRDEGRDPALAGGPSGIEGWLDRFLPGPLEASEGEHDRLLGRLSLRTGGSRFVPDAEVGRGGMGAVHRVWDEELERPLAMKVIAGSEAPGLDPRRLSRFLTEAQVTGQLDHPGIVPVHELGLDANGQVYFTMKLVEGESLAQIFARVRDGDPGWSSTRALNVLQRVCEAMAYAHEKGVVHRDLKPANVMVGRHGEVYVMDWGLARVADRQDVHDIRLRESAQGPGEHSGSIVTAEGTVIGTPYYMPPEQAAGRVSEVDARSDVYAVGAMLYELLSGVRPYSRRGQRDTPAGVLERVRAGAPQPLGGLVPDAPVELVSICEQAMARERGARYADMGELSEDLRAFLENRVVRAHRTGAWIELRKWVSRNRGLALLGGVLLVLLPVLAVLGAQVARNRDEVREGLAQARRERAEDHLTRGFAHLAERRQADARAAFERALGELPLSLEARSGLVLSSWFLDDYQGALDDLRGAPGDELAWVEVQLLDLLGREEEARALGDAIDRPANHIEIFALGLRMVTRAKAERDRARLLEGLVLLERAVLGAPAARPMFHLDYLLALTHAEKPVAAAELARGVRRLWPEVPSAQFAAGWALQRSGNLEEALAAYREAERLDSDYPELQNNIGSVLLQLGETEEAILALEQALRVHPDSANAYVNLSNAYDSLGDKAGALSALERALELDPDLQIASRNLARLIRAGGLEDARDVLLRAVEHDPDDVQTLLELGGVLRELRELSQAESALAKAASLAPNRSDVANLLGLVLMDLGQFEDARVSLERAVALDPMEAGFLVNLAEVLWSQGANELAVETARAAVALEPDLAVAYSALAGALLVSGVFGESREAIEQAMRLDPEASNYSVTLANIEMSEGDPWAAIDALEGGLAVDPEDAGVHYHLALTRTAVGDREGAIRAYREACRLRPAYYEAFHNLGCQLMELGQWSEAQACFERVTELRPDFAPAFMNLGQSFEAQARYDLARDGYEQAIELDPGFALAHYSLGNRLRSEGEYEAAVERYRAAIEIAPRFPEAHCNLAQTLGDLGRFEEALVAYRRGHELGIENPAWRYPSGQWVRDAERLAALEARLMQVLEEGLLPERSEELALLANVAYRKRMYSESAELYAGALDDERLAATPPHRYNAACSAALAADANAEPLWAERAVEWLSLELGALRRAWEQGETERTDLLQQLAHWRTDMDLAPIRDADRLDGWPDALRLRSVALWDGVTALVGELREEP